MLGLNNLNRRFDWLVILPSFVIVCSSIPWIVVRVRMIFLVPFIVLYALLVCLRQKKSGFESPMEKRAGFFSLLGALGFFLSYLVISSQARDEFNYGWFANLVFSLFYLWTFIRLAAENKVNEIKVLALVTLSVILISAFMGTRFLSEEANRDMIRLVTGSQISIEEENSVLAAGAGWFATVYSIGLLSVPITYAIFRVRWRIKVVFSTISLFSLLYAYRAGFSILISVIGAGMMLCLLSAVIKRIQLFHLFAIAALCTLVYLTINPSVFSFLAGPVSSLAEMTDNPNYAMRLTSIAEALGGNLDQYAVSRTGLLWVSWREFLKSPLVGGASGWEAIGQHSFIFDYLAMGGIFFFLPFLFFFYSYTKYLKIVVYPLSPSSRYLIEVYFYMYIMCVILNPLTSTLLWNGFFLTLPGVSLFFTDSKLNKENITRRNWVRRF